MKKFLLLIVAMVAFSAAPASAAETDNGENEVSHAVFASAQYYMGDFDVAKQSSWYGLGLYATSACHWGGFHIGGNFGLSINNGIVHSSDSGMMFCFGPSFRADFSKHFFLNVPINAVCFVLFPDGNTKSHWGGKVAPSFYGFFNDRVGIFAGPNVTFNKNGSSFGMQAGLSICF